MIKPPDFAQCQAVITTGVSLHNFMTMGGAIAKTERCALVERDAARRLVGALNQEDDRLERELKKVRQATVGGIVIRCVSCDRGVTEHGGMCGFCRDEVTQLRSQLEGMERRLEDAKRRADESDAKREAAQQHVERGKWDLQEAWRWIEYARERIASRFLGGTACTVCFGAKGHWYRDADTLRPVWVMCRACDGSGTEGVKRGEGLY